MSQWFAGRGARLRVLFGIATLLGAALPALAQEPPANPPSTTPSRPAQTELNLINLPTTLSIQRHRGYFRLTHRFSRDLRRDTRHLPADLFSLDNNAVIGLEGRFGITRNLQAGVHRSLLSKTIQTFARWDAWRQGETMPVSLSVTASIEGTNNLRQQRQPGVALTVSRTYSDRVALYATPAFVAKTQAVDFIEGHEDHDITLPGVNEQSDHNDTWLLGLGTRLRFSPGGYIVGEYTPRLAGYDPNKAVWGVAIEKRTGGHTLQLNFTNSFGTTLGQTARGGSPHDIYLGFNITRKF
jgi:uncharacterized beta barrel domain-containing protein DUF5777